MVGRHAAAEEENANARHEAKDVAIRGVAIGEASVGHLLRASSADTKQVLFSRIYNNNNKISGESSYTIERKK